MVFEIVKSKKETEQGRGPGRKIRRWFLPERDRKTERIIKTLYPHKAIVLICKVCREGYGINI